MTRESWEDFFSGFTLDIMQESRPEEEIEAEANYLGSLLKLHEGNRLLDVPCGSGRHAILLAGAGYRVTGVDMSEPLLQSGGSEAARLGVDLDLRRLDMRELPWRAEFDAAICMWGSFGYFDDPGNISFLQTVSKALKPNGRFLVDTPVVETVLPGFRPSDWTKIGRTMLLETRYYDHVRGRLDRSWTMLRGREVEKRTLSMRLYTYSQLCGLLYEAGFSSCTGYSTLDGEPFKLGADRVFMLATKGA